MPKATARIRIQLRTRRQTQAVADALTPEASHPAGKRAQATISTRGNQLTLRLAAQDSATLRAIVTSYVRMLKATHTVLEKIDRSQASLKDNKH